MNKIKFWFDNSRNISLPQSMLPAILAVAMSIGQPDFSWWLALLAVIGVAIAHLGMNLADDYFDYKQNSVEIRKKLTEEGGMTHIEKCHYIVSGKATVKDLAIAICVFLGIAGTLGAIIFWFRGWPIALLALIGLGLGISYSGKPLKLCYRGLGELVIGIMFGPLLMLGTNYAACGQFSTDVAFISVAIGLFVTNIVYVHSIIDINADLRSHKETFAALLGTERRQLIALATFHTLAYILVIVGICVKILSPWCLLTLITCPLGYYMVYSTWCFLNHKEIDTTPRWWMGPMGDWKAYCEYHMDWFLARWLLARNIVTFFSLILIIIYVTFYFL